MAHACVLNYAALTHSITHHSLRLHLSHTVKPELQDFPIKATSNEVSTWMASEYCYASEHSYLQNSN